RDADRGLRLDLRLLVCAATGNDRHGCDRAEAEFGAEHGYLRIKTPRKRSADYADPPRGGQFADAAVSPDEPAGPSAAKRGGTGKRGRVLQLGPSCLLLVK